MVESIGLMHVLNAQDVMNWLGTLPYNDARAAGMEKIHEAFPQLRTGLAAEVISLE